MKIVKISTLLLMTGLCTGQAAATCRSDIDPVAPDSRYEVQTDSSEVLDKQTGLIWQRCSLGQTWNAGTGQCDGAASTHTWTQAVGTAAGNWRLPNVKELNSLVASECINPSINETLFPNTPGSYFWTSSPYAGNSGSAWLVYFYNGVGYDGVKYGARYVRLVRASQ